MADFAEWATACETAFWPSGTFMTAYNDNLLEVVDTVLEADLVGSTLRLFAEDEAPWTGTASDASGPTESVRQRKLDAVAGLAKQPARRSPTGSAAPRLSCARSGVEIAFDRGSDRQRSRDHHSHFSSPRKMKTNCPNSSEASDIRNVQSGEPSEVSETPTDSG